MRGSSQPVAVKVQHRWIKEQVPGDIRLTEIGVGIGCWIFPDFKYQWLPEEFRDKLPRELDFKLEMLNSIRCKEIFKGSKTVFVPYCYEDLTKERVLVMSFEDGTSVQNVKQIHKMGYDLKQVSKIISQAFVHMIFKEGFVHADPHPGNILVRRNKQGGTEIVLLDHGIYTTLRNETRLGYAKLWRGIL